MRPDPPAMTPEHSCARPHNSNGDLTLLRQHKRLPEFPVVPGEESQASHRNSRQTTRCPRQRETRPFSPAAPREHSRVPSQNSRGGLTPFMQLKIPVTTRDERRVSRHKSRRAPCFPPHPEMRAHSLLQLKRNPNVPSHHKRRPVSPIKSRVEPRGSCCKGKGRRVPPPLQISPDSTAPAPMEHRVSPHKRMGDLSPMLILLKKPKFNT